VLPWLLFMVIAIAIAIAQSPLFLPRLARALAISAGAA